MGRVTDRLKRLGALLMLMAGAALSACDAGPSAVLPDGQGASPPAQVEKAPVWAEADKATSNPPAVDAQSSNDIKGEGPAPSKGLEASNSATEISNTRYGEWPLWSYNRKYKAIENAQYHFEKHGPEFGAKSYADWLFKVHGFIHNPPFGTQTIKRNNGDTLFYNAVSNTFAVMTKKGAPRTMFKPEDGAAYWQKQKDIESKRRTITRDNKDGDE